MMKHLLLTVSAAKAQQCSYFFITMTEYFIIDETQNYNKLPWLIKVILYYEVPQNALCSLCLHCLNSGSKKTPGDLLSIAESKTSWDKVC